MFLAVAVSDAVAVSPGIFLRAVTAAPLALALAGPGMSTPALGQEAAETPAEVSELCGERTERPFDRTPADLYCLRLHPTASGGEATGVVELGRVAGPYGVTVTAAGRHLHELTAWIAGLPEPGELGPYTAFVAWATTPRLEPVVRLGTVEDGRNPLGPVDFNQFLVLITAEEDPATTERHGQLVLRGRSPSMLMEPHDLLGQAPAALRAPERRDDGEEAHPHGHAVEADGWRAPPMYPGMPMLPGLRGLTPSVSPRVLEAGPIEKLPEARPARLVELPDGGTLDLEAGFVRRRIAGRDLAMLAFNRQYPGPLIRVPEDATIFVNFTNRTPLPSSVHWHGVRLENPFDGVPGITQDPVMPGETFRYRVHFRDAGIYWYHPHHREDIQQELGLYGNILVDPPPAAAYGPVHHEEVLILDDLLLDEEGIVPFGEGSANFALMGRFGNVFLVNGRPEYTLRVERGAVVRFHLTNASNTRTLNVSFVPRDGRATHGAEEPSVPGGEPAAPLMKVVGSDIGKFERQQWVESVVLAPAERYTVEVRFDRPGTFGLANRVQGIDHLRGAFVPEETELGSVVVSPEPAEPDLRASFEILREHAEVVAEIDRYRPEFGRPPDLELVLDMRVRDLPPALEQLMLYDWIYFHPVEWAGTMPVMNWATTGEEVRWILRDPATGAENMEIDWRFRLGEVVKVRVHNERDAFHAMQHPLHIHGQRFLILEQNGVPNENLVWKDTALLPVGTTTDILLELSNPGRWMVHCHIAEHLDAGMMFVMDVEDSNPTTGGPSP